MITTGGDMSAKVSDPLDVAGAFRDRRRKDFGTFRGDEHVVFYPDAAHVGQLFEHAKIDGLAQIAHGVRVFEQRYVTPLETTLARMRLDPSMLDEVKQIVREKLLVRAEGQASARIDEYAGRGRLAGLVQVVATREALTLLRRGAREVQRDEDLVGEIDPGLEMLKAKYNDAFKTAFAGAVSALTPSEQAQVMTALGGSGVPDTIVFGSGVTTVTLPSGLPGLGV